MGHRGIGWIDQAGTRHLRWSVPAADESVQAWIDAQADVGASLRAAVRMVVEAHGVTDLVNRPVEQRPRRGHPPGSRTRHRRSSTTAGQDAPAAVDQPPSGGVAADGAAVDINELMRSRHRG